MAFVVCFPSPMSAALTAGPGMAALRLNPSQWQLKPGGEALLSHFGGRRELSLPSPHRRLPQAPVLIIHSAARSPLL